MKTFLNVTRSALLLGAALSCLDSAALAAGGGGTPKLAINHGSWSDPAIWSPAGVPGPDDDVEINGFQVTVGDPGQVAGTVRLGSGSGITTFKVPAGGELTVDSLFVGVGSSNSCTMSLEGGELDAGWLEVGSQSAGRLHLSTGVLRAETLRLGADGHAADMIGSGSEQDLTLEVGSLVLGPGLFLSVTPVDGSQNLAPFEAVDVDLGTGSQVFLEAAQLMQGEVFEIVRYSGTLTGSIGEVLELVPGLEYDVDDATPGLVQIVVSQADTPWSIHGQALAGAAGEPFLRGTGDLTAGSTVELLLTDAAPFAPVYLVLGLQSQPVAFYGGTLTVFPFVSFRLVGGSDGDGDLTLSATTPAGIPAATELWAQMALVDAGSPEGVALTHAVRGLTP